MLYLTVCDSQGNHELTWHVGTALPGIFQPLAASAPRREIVEVQVDGDELYCLLNPGRGKNMAAILRKHSDPSSTERVMVWKGCWAGMIYGLLLGDE